MTRTRLATTLALALAALGGAACSDSTTPVPGTLTFSLNSPNVDGAAVLEIAGPFIATPVPGSPVVGYLASQQVAPTTMRVLVVGNLIPGPIVTISVPDVNAAGSYTGTILEVADRNNQLRASLSAYSVTVSTP